ncbi:MAG TPA: UDP-N-acetylmuramate dehydrogenase [Tepidisphaeraceae bacterium]|jgi:UDP-N-acetylmuramate dehydrogenase
MQLATPKPFEGLDAIVTADAPLAPLTWYKIGGPAKYLVRPKSVEQLQEASRRCVEHGLPIYVLGHGANVLVNDRGVDGAVFRFDDPFWSNVDVSGDNVKVGAGADMAKLVVNLARQGLAGFECMAGIPGTIGGGIRMNAGGKYGDIGAIVSRVTVMDSHGEVFERTKQDLVFEYRRTNIVAPFILGATLELDADDANAIAHRTKEIWMYKRNTQPLNTKNCGCVFKNPRGISAGALIDQAGLKGLRVGGAEVSAKHANFVVAHPGATADDVLKLIKVIQDRVYDKHQTVLESEVKIWPV